MTNIPLVDDKSLDSTSEYTADFERHKRRHNKPKKRDVETNTDQTFDLQRSFFDEKGNLIFILKSNHLSSLI
jgi:hypothetical protein